VTRRGARADTPDVVAPPALAALERAAARYIDRYAPNSQRLRAFLLRRGASEEQVAEVIAKVTRAGLVDDAAWAESKARRLIQRGVAPALTRQRLRQEGLDARDALAAVADEQGDPELIAARAYARRRRLGPWRAERDDESRAGDLARMGRAGFSYTVAVRVIDGEAL
jgi:regulatory protein